MKLFQIFSLLFAFVFTSVVVANATQTSVVVAPPKTAKVTIKTSAVCDMCEKNIKKALSVQKGVKSVSMNMDTKEVTVVYSPSKTNVDTLRQAISNAGYDADEVKANPTAHNKLEACCKKGSSCDMKK